MLIFTNIIRHISVSINSQQFSTTETYISRFKLKHFLNWGSLSKRQCALFDVNCLIPAFTSGEIHPNLGLILRRSQHLIGILNIIPLPQHLNIFYSLHLFDRAWRQSIVQQRVLVKCGSFMNSIHNPKLG